jgi:hypothetical protein
MPDLNFAPNSASVFSIFSNNSKIPTHIVQIYKNKLLALNGTAA